MNSVACAEALDTLSCAKTGCILRGGNLYFCGNGGSYADACHIAAEFTGRLKLTRKSLPASILGSNPASLTAIANDFDYRHVFSRELSSIAKQEDLLIAISTSGRSPNILECIKVASQLKIDYYLLTSACVDSSLLPDPLRIITVPFTETDIVQEVHKSLLHSVCELTETLIA